MRSKILTIFASTTFALLLSFFSISAVQASTFDPHVPVTNLPVCSYLTTYTAPNTHPAPHNWGDVLGMAYQSMNHAQIAYSEVWVHDVTDNVPAAFLSAIDYGQSGEAHVDTAGANPNVHAVYELMFIHTLHGHTGATCRSNAHYINLMPSGGHAAPAPSAAHHATVPVSQPVAAVLHHPRHVVVIDHHGHSPIAGHDASFHGNGLYQGHSQPHHTHTVAGHHHAVALYEPLLHAVQHEVAAHETTQHGVNLYNNTPHTHHGNAGLYHTTAPVTHHFAQHTAPVQQPAHQHQPVVLYQVAHVHHAAAPAGQHVATSTPHAAPASGALFHGFQAPAHHDPTAYIPVTHLYGGLVAPNH